MRNGALIRVLTLAQRLQSRRWLLDDLAQELGVTTRTIRRDLETLSSVGFRVRNTADAAANGLNGFWWMERGGSPVSRPSPESRA